MSLFLKQLVVCIEPTDFSATQAKPEICPIQEASPI